MNLPPKVCQEENCYWFESNGLHGKEEAVACRSPKWEWTDDETTAAHEQSRGKPFAVRSMLPPFDFEKHCDFKPVTSK